MIEVKKYLTSSAVKKFQIVAGDHYINVDPSHVQDINLHCTVDGRCKEMRLSISESFYSVDKNSATLFETVLDFNSMMGEWEFWIDAGDACFVLQKIYKFECNLSGELTDPVTTLYGRVFQQEKSMPENPGTLIS